VNRILSTLGLCAASLTFLGCSDGGADTPAEPSAGGAGSAGAGQVAEDAGADAVVPEEPDSAPPLSPACAALQPGLNEGFDVDGELRSFILDLPTDVESTGPWPVVFNWHGLGDTAQNMHGLLSSQINRPDFAFIAVTPEDTDHVVSAMGMSVNLDWDVFQVGDGESNREVRLFDEIMLCLDARFGVDTQRVHTTGFSIGAIVADMLGVVRGNQIASIATYSGAYFSNPDNVKALGLLSAVGIEWPSPTHTNPYPQMILFGGKDDVWSPTAGVDVRFQDFAANDRKALSKSGHVVVYCDHGLGHMAPPSDMQGNRLVDFFRDNPKGISNSPYVADGLPSNFASYCELVSDDDDET
jgi:poly(3-hydroxybutyrate) depolymerase